MDVQYSCSAACLMSTAEHSKLISALDTAYFCKFADILITLSCIPRCVVIEDSQIGLRAAKAAGMTCIVTKSAYTQNEDFANADAVVDCIGDSGQERFSLHNMLEITKAAAVTT